MKRQTRILSLLLAVLMVATLLPWDTLGLAPMAEAANDGSGITIDFEYEEKNHVKSPEEALTLLGEQNATYLNETHANYYKDAVNNPTIWKHATSWSVQNDDGDGDLGELLESTDPADTYISLVVDDVHEHHGRKKWKTTVITTNKVLDLNGHKLGMEFCRNRNNGDDHYQNDFPDVLNCTAFEIDNGATLTIIDSSAWRGEGTGEMWFTAYMIDPYAWDVKYYTTRDLFKVNDGNLIIYGGTFQAGRQKQQFKKNFTWKKLKTAIGSAVSLGTSIAEYATGVSVASASYKDLVENMTDMTKINDQTEDSDGNTGDDGASVKRDGSDAPAEKKLSTPTSDVEKDPNGGREQTVGEKKASKNSDPATGKGGGTPEGENKKNDKDTGKNDKNTKLTEAKNKIVDAALDKGKISGMVDDAFSLVENIAGMFGYDVHSRVTQSIKGTVVSVGNNGCFVAYGGKFIGYGDTPNTKNAVIECAKLTGTKTLKDTGCTKDNGGLVYIYGGTFEARAGANVFNMVRARKDGKTQMVVKNNETGEISKETVTLTDDETGGVIPIYYEDEDDAGKEGFEYKPISTRNVQVRGGTFRCYYEALNLATGEGGKGDDNNFRKYPGTPGCVNLGIESYGEDLIQDGRIQIVDSYGDGAQVLLDERIDEKLAAQEAGQPFTEGLYHYRLFCGDNELRAKTYLTVYPNTAKTNSSHSMQLATYYGKGKRTSLLFVDDKENDRAPYRQTENYFDFYFDDPQESENWSVRPNFHDTASGSMDVYGERMANSEIWYYSTPLDADGDPIVSPFYGSAYYTASLKNGGGIVNVPQQRATDDEWEDVLEDVDPTTLHYRYRGARINTNLKYFTYKVYRVDPLTRENISESDVYGSDVPLITVRYGGDDDSLKCKLPLKEVERQIMARQEKENVPAAKRWKGYQAGEMYRIVLNVEEQVGIYYQGGGLYGDKLNTAKSESTILFRCLSQNETISTGNAKKEHDFTALQWITEPALGQTAKVQIINGRAGLTDFEHDNKIFDVYYQWWEVDKNGKPVKLLAGTDNVYDGPDLESKADHHPRFFDIEHDGKTYVNTVNPSDPKASSYGENGLPADPLQWTCDMLHMYTFELTPRSRITDDGSMNLTPEHNDVFATNTDTCYIPASFGGKTIQVWAIVLNYKWSDVFDKKQTFKSHSFQIPPGVLSGNASIVYPPVPSQKTFVGITGGTAQYIPNADKQYQWQISSDGENGWTDITGATTSSYYPTKEQLGKYIRCVVTCEQFTGALYTPPRQVAKRKAANPERPSLTYESGKVYLNNTNLYQEYLILDFKKDNPNSSISASEWTAAVKFNASGRIWLEQCTQDKTWYVYTRVAESDSTEVGTSVVGSWIYAGDGSYMTDLAFNVSGVDYDIANRGMEYFCKLGQVVRIDVDSIPSAATNFQGVRGDSWGINNSTYGTFFADSACTHTLSSGTYYKTVYFKPAKSAELMTLEGSVTIGYNSLVRDWFWLNVGDESGNIPIRNMVLLPETVVVMQGQMQTMDAELYVAPFGANTSNLTVVPETENAKTPVITPLFDENKLGVDATHSDTGTYAYKIMQGSTQVSAFSVKVVDESCTVSFSANGGSGTMPSVKLAAGASYVLPYGAFTPPAGKEFAAWTNGPAGTRVTITKDTTFYALYKAKAENPFADVSAEEYYCNPVLWAYTHDPQITTGTDETHYSPEEGCTRAQVVTFLWRAAGKPAPGGSNPFKDVPTGEYYTDAVIWAVGQGITTGTDADAFSPNDTCTRAQIVTFLWRFKGKPKPSGGANPFKDVPAGEYYTDAVLWAVEKGVTNGTEPDQFSPDATCTRGQIVTFLYRADPIPASAGTLIITAQPKSGHYDGHTEGADYTLTVKAAGGTVPYSYEWHQVYTKYSGKWDTVGTVKDEILPGAVNASCAVSSSAEYYCVITDAADNKVTSAKVAAGPAPEIIAQPKGGVCTSRMPCLLEVGVFGGAGGVSYQWYRNGNPISGATERTYEAYEAGSYKVVIKDAITMIGSEEVTVTQGGKNNVNLLGKDDFLIYVEDYYEVTGRGPVIIGRVQNGRVDVGDKLRFMTWDSETGAYKEYEVTVDGIEMFHKSMDYAEKNDNVGLLLTGISKDQIQRGSALVDKGTTFKATTGPVKGSIYVNSQEEGGRHTPFFATYKPQFYYGGANDITATFTDLGSAEMCIPGNQYDGVTVGDLIVPVFWYAGQQITFREGGRTIGVLTITEVEP